MAFLKSLFIRGYGKHEKLETRILCCDEDDHEFQVRYLGVAPISESNSKKTTAQVIRNIVQMAKQDKDKNTKVNLTINSNGVRLHQNSSFCLLEIPLGHISYCSADIKFGHVFALVCIVATGELECHAFLCDSKKKAREIATTLNKVFQTVFVNMKINDFDM